MTDLAAIITVVSCLTSEPSACIVTEARQAPSACRYDAHDLALAMVPPGYTLRSQRCSLGGSSPFNATTQLTATENAQDDMVPGISIGSVAGGKCHQLDEIAAYLLATKHETLAEAPYHEGRGMHLVQFVSDTTWTWVWTSTGAINGCIVASGEFKPRPSPTDDGGM